MIKTLVYYLDGNCANMHMIGITLISVYLVFLIAFAIYQIIFLSDI